MAELAAAPESYEGAAIWVDGPFELSPPSCTAAFCSDPSVPCNDCTSFFGMGDPSDREHYIVLTEAEDWPYEARTEGVSGTGFASAGSSFALACNGNDLALDCAPAVPARITSVHGVLERGSVSSVSEFAPSSGWRFVVDEIVLADGPTEQVVDGVTLSE